MFFQFEYSILTFEMNDKNLETTRVNTSENFASSGDAIVVRTVIGSALLKLEMAVIRTISERQDPSAYALKVYTIMDSLETYAKVFEHIKKNMQGINAEEYGQPIKKTRLHKSAAEFHQEDRESDVRVEKALNHAYHNFRDRNGVGKEKHGSELEEVIGQCKLYYEQFSLLASEISEASKKFDELEQSEAIKNSVALEPNLTQTGRGDDINQTGQKQQQSKKKTGLIGKLKDTVKDLLQK